MISRKLKKCKKCGEQCYLWSGGMCKPCWAMENPESIKIGRGTKKVKPQSTRQKKRLDRYKELRDVYLREHPVCEVCNSKRSNQIHHRAGRDGDNLFRHFLAVCEPCHHKVEMEPEWAKENGYSISRLIDNDESEEHRHRGAG